jgi:ABC-type nitrate/sulfonate/bicarbonate transport system substrate-binding protein
VIGRRTLLGAGLWLLGGAASAVGLGAVAGCRPATRPSGDAVSQSVSLQLAWIKNVEFAGSYLADARGYHRDEGLRVRLLAGGPSVVTPPVVASGRAQVGIASLDAVAQARGQGAPLKVIGALYRRSPLGIVSLARRPLRSPADLQGARIGIQPSNEVSWNAFLDLNGLEASSIRTVPVEFDPSPLVAGEVEGFMAFATVQPVSLKLQGIETVMLLFEDFGYHLFANVYIATDQDVARRQEMLRGLLRAEARGWRDNLQDPEAGARLTVERYGSELGLKLPEQVAENRAQIPFVSHEDGGGLLAMPETGMDQSIATLARLGLSVSAAELFAPDLVGS